LQALGRDELEPVAGPDDLPTTFTSPLAGEVGAQRRVGAWDLGRVIASAART